MFKIKNTIKLSALITSSLIISACDTVDDIPKVPAPEAVIITDEGAKEGGECASLSPWGFPQPVSGETQRVKQYVCHQQYALLYNSSTGVSDWIVEKLTPENLSSTLKYLPDNFRPDPALHDENAISPKEYEKGNAKGWVKGIITGVGDYRSTKKGMSQAYYMTNVGPMEPYMYEHVYSRLNKNIRKWTKDYGNMYVISGPIYYNGKPLDFLGNKSIGALVVEGKTAKLGEGGKARIAVPTHYFKVIFSPKLKQSMVYVIPNQAFHPQYLQQYKTSLNNVKMLTGFEFFPQFPDQLKNELSNQVANWPISLDIVEPE